MKSLTAILCALISIQCCCCSLSHSHHLCFNYAVFPAHIEELRTSYRQIKNYFQRKDDNIKITLLERKGLPGFKDNHSCKFLKEMLNFYLKDVIPAARTHKRTINSHISKIGNALHELHENVQNCHQFFNCDLCSCNKVSYFKNIHRTFKQLQVKGVYKAMGELNTFIDWIWNYINMRRN
ncbi:interleukin-10 isoform X1 [Pristis pectinata]|uniref:interleukin-10 isoform X1 n=1 Tax=Pristis pectinata TaxID=685728 RepID=UPI00223E7842|nr:interleukin-10 isoform X1 [Pristis pectinata]